MPVISVIWSLAVLSAIALSLSWSGNISTSLANNSLRMLEVNSIAEAAVNRAVASLYEVQPESRWRVDGTPQFFEFEGIKIKISIQDELGKIDLNQADESAFVGLLQSVGFDPDAATRLADKIVDWRTTIALKHLNGAKDAEYRASGSEFLPRNGPFQSVDELLLVMGMTQEVYSSVEPALTVYSARQFIDPQVAPREALLALPTMTPDSIDSILAARGSLAPTQGLAGVAQPSLSGRAFTVHSEYFAFNSTIRHDAVIRLTGSYDQPFWLLSWKYR